MPTNDPLDIEVGGEPQIHSDDNASLTKRVGRLEAQVSFLADNLRQLVIALAQPEPDPRIHKT